MLCNSLDAHGISFTLRDQTLWLDKYAELVQLDWSTGRVIKTLSTQRRRNVCSLAMPEAGGFINYQGDTVSFQKFEGLTSPTSKRQIVEVKRGWYASDVSWANDAEQPLLTVAWRVKPETTPPKGRQGEVLDMLISTYDVSSMRRTREVSAQTDSYEMGYADASGSEDARSTPGCPSQSSPGKKVLRFESSHFGSLRAYRCAGGEDVETVFWTGLDIAPKSQVIETPSTAYVLAIGETIGVASDSKGIIHIFDVITRKELAQIQPTDQQTTQLVRLSESDGIVVLESLEDSGKNNVRSLRAYFFK